MSFLRRILHASAQPDELFLSPTTTLLLIGAVIIVGGYLLLW